MRKVLIIEGNELNREILASILEVAMFTARKLGTKVVAEGVETAKQVEALKSMGAGTLDIYAQGYYYSKPIPMDQFREYIQNR